MPGMWPNVVPKIALNTNANNCPETIMNSFCVTIRPRRFDGATSARNVGTITEAPPTAKPKTKRTDAKIGAVGDNVEAMVETTNKIASPVMTLCRPRRSEMRPVKTAPKAAPNVNELATKPSMEGDIFSSPALVINGNAPLITPVSYPKSIPPNVAIIEITRKRRRADFGNFSDLTPKSGWGASAASPLLVTTLLYACY